MRVFKMVCNLFGFIVGIYVTLPLWKVLGKVAWNFYGSMLTIENIVAYLIVIVSSLGFVALVISLSVVVVFIMESI